MLSKSQISFLKSLQQKKGRKEHRLFLVEGIKSVTEFINSDYHIETIYHTPALGPKLLKLSQKINLREIPANILEKISSFTTPQDVIALIKIPQWAKTETAAPRQSFTLALDGIQDPGNLGTIIRTADWFGIKNIICSEDTVDAYNPKVVQATMGSLARVNIHYLNLADFIRQTKLPVFGALLAGSNIYNTDFGTEGLVVMGNEGNGIRAEIEELIQHRVTIPQPGKTESLNVAIATAIFCSEISRKTLK
ncbi:RNA methyltransferase [Mucilaginibacter sp. PPCGB 2223]|uniref:TrmH family RNA methyltransferase n=1 Tax=Mucilaginibacter sp. PPCGB 2223 TaxID=1886027 RepID=UPI000826B1CA|nr:RNA methyltransferase [Mucilaginibacter sp. PPCGB 2223]OCX52902.1 RNA methyltransferase [Mucilaginibacter sp. PPCGB 2223]